MLCDFNNSIGILIISILFDLGDTLIHLDKPTDQVVESRLEAFYASLLDEGADVEYNQLASVYGAVHSEMSGYSDESGIETTTDMILIEVLRRLAILENHSWYIDDLVRKFFAPEIESWIVYEDTLKVLMSLRDQGFSLGLVSNARSHWAVLEIMKRLGIYSFFDKILTSAEVGVRKPHHEIFQRALNNFGSDPSSTVMVGNNLCTDVKGAKELNIRTIYLEREISNQTSIQPDVKVKSLSEILDTISDWNKT